jgi:hypothetical protein
LKKRISDEEFNEKINLEMIVESEETSPTNPNL